MFLNKYVLSEQTFRDQLEYIKIHFNVFFFYFSREHVYWRVATPCWPVTPD